MRVSFNELHGLCRRAFEGLGFASGDHEDAAEMVAWLEQHGLGGIDALRRGFDHLAENDATRLQRVYDDPSLAVVDAAGNSVLVCGSLGADLAYTKARRKGLAVVKLQNCHNRKLMLGYLARCARRGMNILALWRHAEAPRFVEQAVSMRAWQSYPTLLRYEIVDRDDRLTRNRSITLVCSPHFALLGSLHPDPGEVTLLEALDPDDFERKSRQVWQHGMEVDEAVWDRLKELFARTQVEQTDRAYQPYPGEGGGVGG